MHDERGSSAGAARDRRRGLGRLVRIALLALVFALPAAGAVLNFVVVYVDDSPAVPDGLDGAAGVAITRPAVTPTPSATTTTPWSCSCATPRPRR